MSIDFQQINRLLILSALSQTEIAKKLSISQASVSITLSQNRDRVIKVGKARATRFYLLRPIAGEHTWPIYRVTAEGVTEVFADLHSVYPEGFAYYLHRDACWFYSESLPWWMADMRPQGFIGRALAHKQSDLPNDPKDWSDDDVIRVLANNPENAVGNLLIGRHAYEDWLYGEKSTAVHRDELLSIAELAMAGWTGGSSAGGEQPKFCAQLEGHRSDCLIKFTAAIEENNANSIRWADLLRAEHVALQVLSNSSVPSARSELIPCTDGNTTRLFLCVERFDRIGSNGRKGLVSLSMLDAEFVGQQEKRWPFVAEALAGQGVTRMEDVPIIQLAYCFGKLIANTDMHQGNLSFLHLGSKPLILAPIYDMLPMYFAPTAAGAMRSEQPQIQLDPEIGGQVWRQAYEMAIEFWEDIASDRNPNAKFSASFREIARGMLQYLQLAIKPVIAKMVK